MYARQLTSVVNQLTKVSAIATAFTFTKGSYTFNLQFQLTLWPNVGVGTTERVLLGRIGGLVSYFNLPSV